MPRIAEPTDNAFLDLMEWRQRRSSQGALGRLEVLADRVRHSRLFWRLTRRF